MEAQNEAKQIIIDELNELVLKLEPAILDMEAAPENRSGLNMFFRLIHTIKGSASLIGLGKVASFTHILETLYDSIRSDEIKINKDIIETTLAAADLIADLIRESGSTQILERYETLAVKINSYIPAPEGSADNPGQVTVLSEDAIEANRKKQYTISRLGGLIGKKNQTKLGGILVEKGHITNRELGNMLQKQMVFPYKDKPLLGDLLIDAGKITDYQIQSALIEQHYLRDIEQQKGPARQTLNIPASAIDNLLVKLGTLLSDELKLSQMINEDKRHCRLRQQETALKKALYEVRNKIVKLRVFSEKQPCGPDKSNRLA